MCRCEFHEDLSAYLDRELDEVRCRALERHLPGCRECADLLQRLKECRAVFADDFGGRVSQDFGRRVQALADPPARTDGRRRRWAWTAGAGAALAAGLALVFLAGRPAGHAPEAVMDPRLLAGPELYEQLAAAGYPVGAFDDLPCGAPLATSDRFGLDFKLPGEAAAGL